MWVLYVHSFNGFFADRCNWHIIVVARRLSEDRLGSMKTLKRRSRNAVEKNVSYKSNKNAQD